jgi:Uma2 family endonuclease
VQEDWLIDPFTEQIEVYLNDAGFFYPKGKFGSGEVSSAVVPGFTVKVVDVFEEMQSSK